MGQGALRPVPGFPALSVEGPRGSDRFVIIADLHLGLGSLRGLAQGPPEGSPAVLADEVLRAADVAGARTIVIAGDVKHPIVGVPAPLRPLIFDFFAELLSAGLRAEVVLGNHDVGLVPSLPKEVRVHPSEGVVRAGVGIFHGHRWPSPRVLAQRQLVAGHLHPGFRFAPSSEDAGAKRRCWVRTTFPPRPARRAPRGSRRRFEATELVVLPPFHPLAGVEALNRSRPARGRSFLFGRFLRFGSSRLYLLDGTDLGPLTIPPRARPKQGPAGARRRR